MTALDKINEIAYNKIIEAFKRCDYYDMEDLEKLFDDIQLIYSQAEILKEKILKDNITDPDKIEWI